MNASLTTPPPAEKLPVTRTALKMRFRRKVEQLGGVFVLTTPKQQYLGWGEILVSFRPDAIPPGLSTMVTGDWEGVARALDCLADYEMLDVD